MHSVAFYVAHGCLVRTLKSRLITGIDRVGRSEKAREKKARGHAEGKVQINANGGQSYGCRKRKALFLAHDSRPFFLLCAGAETMRSELGGKSIVHTSMVLGG